MIHDLLIEPLSRHATDSGWALSALRYEEPRLHRIGWIQVVHLKANQRTPFRLRSRADEVWVLLDGVATFRWHDQRSDSPSKDERHEHSAGEPVRVLAPFGVAFGVHAGDGGATLLRLATEVEGDQDRELPWPTP